MNTLLDKILTEWSYRVHDGMPNPKNPLHIVQLRESMEYLQIPTRVIDGLVNNLLIEQEFPARSKKSGKIVFFTNKDQWKDSIKSGSHEQVSDEEAQAAKKDQKEKDSKDKPEGETGAPPPQSKGMDISASGGMGKKDKGDEEKEDFKNKVNSLENKTLKNILNKNTAAYQNVSHFLNDEEKKTYDEFLKDIYKLITMKGEEKQNFNSFAREIVDKYGMARNVSGKKVYIKNIAFEARKILGKDNQGLDIIRDTLEKALGEQLPAEVKAANPKQIVSTTSKPDLGKESIRHSKDTPEVANIFQDKTFEGIGEEFHQLHIAVDPNTGEVLMPSSKHSKEYLKQSINDNVALQRTISKLEDLEKQGVSPNIKKSLESHQQRMKDLVGGKTNIKIPSKEAREYVEKSYGKLAEEMYNESPTLTKGMFKNMAEMALYDSEIAGGDECYLPSHGSFPSGDKIIKSQGVNGVERVESVSVKFGRTGKYNSFGFPGETGQYQKYHPDPSYRNRNGSRPGDDGFDIGVNNELITDETQFDRVFEESGLADCVSDRGKVKDSIRGILNHTQSEKSRIGYIQNAAQARKEGKPTAKNQILGISKGIRAKNEELSEHLKKHIDYDCLRNKLGKDNANVAMKGPMELMNVLTFCGTLKTSNGLTAVKHNHQEIKEGKLISKTDDGSDNPKLWKFTFRAFEERSGGLITSYNSDRITYDTEEI